MKLYNSKVSPSAKRVRVFLAEKGIELETENLDLVANEARTPAFLKINSLGAVPVLVLDDGTVLTESLAICRYLEALHPEPALFGTDPLSSAQVEMWCRRVEHEVMAPLANVAWHSIPFFATRIAQMPAFAAAERERAQAKLRWLDGELDGRDFLAGERYTMAEVVGVATLEVARLLEIEIDADLRRLHAWIGRLEARPSYQA